MRRNHKRREVSLIPYEGDSFAPPPLEDSGLIPLAEQPDWIPTDPEILRKDFESIRSDLPPLKDKQYQAMEMIFDYLSKRKIPVRTRIAKKLLLEVSTVTRWTEGDGKFAEFQEKVCQKKRISNVLYALHIISEHNREKPTVNTTFALAKMDGLLDRPAEPPDMSKRARSETDEETGLIRWVYERAD